MNLNQTQISNFVKAIENNRDIIQQINNNNYQDSIGLFKKGNKIHIKKENRGKFISYCNGKVTSECISRGKNSPDPKIRKRATFAANVRRWNH